MIDRLTAEQEEQLVAFREECLQIGLNTSRADVPSFKKAIRAIYAELGKEEPYIWRASSPMMVNILLNLKGNPNENLMANLMANLRANRVYAPYFWGSLDIYWLAFYIFPHRFLAEMHTAEQMEKLTCWLEVAKSAFWWWPYEKICFVSDRPCEIHKDADGRLHNPHDMSVKFRDGWGIYNWHGVNIPAQQSWIITDPNRITPSVIDAEGNAEIRRIMLERLGHDQYILQSGLQPVHRDECGELFRKSLAGDEALVMVRVTNSTPEPDGLFKRYLLRVPPTVQTAKEAVAWTAGMDTEQYSPDFES